MITYPIAIIGASGKMGQQVLECLGDFPELNICSALVSHQSKKLGQRCQEKVYYTSDLSVALKEAKLAIDFSVPEISVNVAKICAKNRIPLIIGTTGHTTEQITAIQESAKSCAILMSANFSYGIQVFKKLISQACELLGDDFGIEIMETHHKAKRDAPSGTAAAIVRQIEQSNKQAKSDSHSGSIPSSGKIGLTSIRAGDVVGEHLVHFIGRGERIEVSHKAWDRAIFARGALKSAPLLLKCSPGMYSLEDLILNT